MFPDLKVDIPELDPDPVLLEQLCRLSTAPKVPHGGGPIRTFVATAAFGVIAGVSWLTGTLPGVASPFHLDPSDQAPRHAPSDPGRGGDTEDGVEDGVDDVDEGPTVAPPPSAGFVAPGTTRPDHDNGNHLGQTKPHQDNGHHLGQTKPHQDNGHGEGNVGQATGKGRDA